MFRRRLLQATPLFCGVLVTLPPRKRHERATITKASPAIMSYFGFSFKDAFQKSKLDKRFAEPPQADILVALTIDPFHTVATLVYYPTTVEFPTEVRVENERIHIDMPQPEIVRVDSWPSSEADQVYMNSCISYAEESPHQVIGVGMEEGPGIAFEGIQMIYPEQNAQFEELNLVKRSLPDVLTDYLTLVRVHVETFIKALPNAPDGKIKWMIKTSDCCDEHLNLSPLGSSDMKRTYWNCLRNAGFPVGEVSDEAGMWDHTAYEYMMETYEDGIERVDAGRQESLVELVPATMCSALSFMSTVADLFESERHFFVLRDDAFIISSRNYISFPGARFGILEAPAPTYSQGSPFNDIVAGYINNKVEEAVIEAKKNGTVNADEIMGLDVSDCLSELEMMVSGKKPLDGLTIYDNQFLVKMEKEEVRELVNELITTTILRMITLPLNISEVDTVIVAANPYLNRLYSTILERTWVSRVEEIEDEGAPQHFKLAEIESERSKMSKCVGKNNNAQETTASPVEGGRRIRNDIFEDYPATTRDYESFPLKVLTVDDDSRIDDGLVVMAVLELRRIMTTALKLVAVVDRE